ncbi:MAG: hypothetical protein UHS41_05460 [Lachnospiraceae bacterium]|nr:hypothetical protein [Lachnospiraceae bacterium]
MNEFDNISTVADENKVKQFGKLRKMLTSDKKHDNISNVADKEGKLKKK